MEELKSSKSSNPFPHTCKLSYSQQRPFTSMNHCSETVESHDNTVQYKQYLIKQDTQRLIDARNKSSMFRPEILILGVFSEVPR